MNTCVCLNPSIDRTVSIDRFAYGGMNRVTHAREDGAGKGVNVNCIAPGYCDTEMNTALLADPVRSRQIMERIPSGRWASPQDLVGAAVFLAGSGSDYINGIVLPVDGGWLGR